MASLRARETQLRDSGAPLLRETVRELRRAVNATRALARDAAEGAENATIRVRARVLTCSRAHVLTCSRGSLLAGYRWSRDFVPARRDRVSAGPL
eukprot:1640899-Rhodomonas_salina.2